MKVLKFFVFLTVLVVIVGVGGVAAFIAFADPNDFKEEIAVRVFEKTGRALTLDGELEWAFWPKIKIKAGPLTLSNAPGFGDEPFFAADEIQIAVATLPLLKKQIEMDTVKLYGARVNLAKDAEGVTNWADLAGGEEEQRTSGEIATIALGGVDIQNAAISWRDATAEQNVAISKFNVSTGALTFGDPIAFEMSLQAVADQPALDSDVALRGTVSYDLGDEKVHVEPLDLDIVMRGKSLPGGKAAIKADAIVDIDLEEGLASITGLTLSGLGTELKGDIAATDIESEAPGARGALELKGTDLALIFRAFELPVAKQIGRLKQRSFDFTTEFDANMRSGNVSVPKLEGAMLGATLNANLEAERANTDKPAAKGSLAAKGPDLPSLLAVFGQLQGMQPETLANLIKVLGKAKDKSFDLQTTFDADTKSGQINLPKVEAKLLGNTISGNVASTESGGDKTALKGSVNASGPDLPSLLAIAATFQGPESGLHEMSKSLSGAPNKSFTLTTSFTTGAGSVDLPQLSAKGLGLVIDGKLKGQNMDSDNGTIDGRLAVKGDNISPLLTALGQKDLAKSVKTLNVDAGIKGTMTDVTFSPLSVVAAVKGTGRKKLVNLTLKAGAARANLDQETLAVKELSLKGLGMNITGHLNASKIKTEPVFNGKLNVPNFNLKNVLINLNQKLPRMADPKALTKFGLSTEFKGTKKSIALNKLTMRLDRSTLKGDLAIANFEGPDVRFGLGVDQLNADHYLPPKPKGKGRPVTPEAAAAGAAQLPIATLRKVKIKGDLLVGKLQISGAKMQNVKLSINAAGGRISVNPVAASLYKGSYNGIIHLDATKKRPALTFNTKLTGVQIEPLLFDTTGDRSLSGIANLTANLKSTGNNSTVIKKGLTGPLKFLVQNGVYRGMDVAAMLQQLEVMIESKRPGSIRKGGETRFQTLAGTINFKNGVGANSDLLLDGSGFKITGKGIVANLHNNTMKYDAKVSVDASSTQRGESNYNLGGYEVPIRCRGKIGADACKPDVGDIVEEIAKATVQKEIGKKLEKAIGGDAGKALKELFKF